MICAYCKIDISPAAVKCPACGHDILRQNERSQENAYLLLYLFYLLRSPISLYLIIYIWHDLETNIVSKFFSLLMLGIILIDISKLKRLGLKGIKNLILSEYYTVKKIFKGTGLYFAPFLLGLIFATLIPLDDNPISIIRIFFGLIFLCLFILCVLPSKTNVKKSIIEKVGSLLIYIPLAIIICGATFFIVAIIIGTVSKFLSQL